MDFKGLDDFNEFIKNCIFNVKSGSNPNNQGAGQSSGQGGAQGDNSNSTEGCEDIPFGFQDLNPQIFVVMGELIGDVMAGNLPFNLQNAIGNWFELIGQVILTYNSQQQYFQTGPGRYYNRKNRNIVNPYCTSNTQGSGSSSSSTSSTGGTASGVSNTSSNSSNVDYENQIRELTQCVNTLVCEVESLKSEIKHLKSST